MFDIIKLLLFSLISIIICFLNKILLNRFFNSLKNKLLNHLSTPSQKPQQAYTYLHLGKSNLNLTVTGMHKLQPFEYIQGMLIPLGANDPDEEFAMKSIECEKIGNSKNKI